MASMQQENVLLPIRWDAKQGKLFLGVPLTEKGGTTSPEYVLADSLTFGVGQNDLRLDRGQVGIQADGSFLLPRMARLTSVRGWSTLNG